MYEQSTTNELCLADTLNTASVMEPPEHISSEQDFLEKYLTDCKKIIICEFQSYIDPMLWIYRACTVYGRKKGVQSRMGTLLIFQSQFT